MGAIAGTLDVATHKGYCKGLPLPHAPVLAQATPHLYATIGICAARALD